ncbi:MAG: PP2C family serine/threonine-protein phosphatase [Nostoc sp.]|uniref:PP2C family serine/threonine-protein phosphatase n=1 Tax=Nostoc sp. TaxID=1180 RepID=UPI002FF95DDC
MQCMSCGASILADDKFCEECGTPLTVSKPSTVVNGCEKCGAEIAAIDAEGYCSQCGFRQEPRQRNWLEVIINSQLAGVSDRGLKHHRNEDFLALQQLHGTQSNILIVCDGVSSSQKPDLAAQAAAESTCLALVAAGERGENPDSAIKSAFITALASVCNITYISGINLEPPSTTIVAAVVQEGIATIGWLGDSRAYWISAHSCQQLTQDNSWLTEVVAAGEMTEIEARKSRKAHAITRWLGADAVEDAVPSIVNFTIPSSGYLILCSDGLWNYTLDASHLANLVQRSPNTDAIAISRTLVEFARQSGGHDNITVAVLCV